MTLTHGPNSETFLGSCIDGDTRMRTMRLGEWQDEEKQFGICGNDWKRGRIFCVLLYGRRVNFFQLKLGMDRPRLLIGGVSAVFHCFGARAQSRWPSEVPFPKKDGGAGESGDEKGSEVRGGRACWPAHEACVRCV